MFARGNLRSECVSVVLDLVLYTAKLDLETVEYSRAWLWYSLYIMESTYHVFIHMTHRIY